MQRILTVIAILAATAILAGCSTQQKSAGKPAAAKAGTINGAAQAINGKRLVIDGKTVELWGLIVPSMSDPSGWYARDALDKLVGRQGKLSCTVRDKPRKKIVQVSCSNKARGDIGRAMLMGGWAVVSRIRTKSNAAWAGIYEAAESLARQNRAGLWSLKPK